MRSPALEPEHASFYKLVLQLLLKFRRDSCLCGEHTKLLGHMDLLQLELEKRFNPPFLGQLSGEWSVPSSGDLTPEQTRKWSVYLASVYGPALSGRV